MNILKMELFGEEKKKTETKNEKINIELKPVFNY